MMENNYNTKENNQSSEQNFSPPVNPNVNAMPSQGLADRINKSAKSHHPKGRTGLFIFLVVIFVLIGIGGWWYYAYGQAIMMLKSAKWDWGTANLENYQQDISLNLQVRTMESGEQDMYAMFFGGQQFSIDGSSIQKNVGVDMENKISLNADSGMFSFDIDLATKKVGESFYLNVNLGGLEDVFGGMISMPDIKDTWFEMDVEDSYNLNLSKETLDRINVRYDQYLNNLVDNGIFDIKDLKKDESGLRKIELTMKDNKVDKFLEITFAYMADVYDIVYDVNKGSEDYRNYVSDYRKDIDKMKQEKPEDWQRLKNAFKNIRMILAINESTKTIHGFEFYLDNMVFDSKYSSTVINGNTKYYIQKIDPYIIESPADPQKIESIMEVFMPNEPEVTMVKSGPFTDTDTDGDGLGDYLEEIYGTDPNNPDSDGDGYLDGEEVNNGYNPMGEGELDLPVSVDDWGFDDFSPDDVQLEPGTITESLICEDTGGTWVSTDNRWNDYCLCPGEIKKIPDYDGTLFVGCN